MKNKYFNFTILVIMLLVATACVSNKKVIYFQEEEAITLNETLVKFEPTIQFGDVLSINVSAIDAEAAIPFNIYETPITKGVYSNAKPLTYLVNADGEINFPVLGKFKVSQLTTKQLTNKLNKSLLPYLKNPIVNVRLSNFKVTVIGEVKTPGTYTVLNERISILEAIGMAGDLTIQGKRNSVTLIRELDGKRTFIPIDLSSKKIFNSPYYYLAQNDVIYVEPNKTKVNSSVVGSNTSVIISSISILISLIAILVR